MIRRRTRRMIRRRTRRMIRTTRKIRKMGKTERKNQRNPKVAVW